MEEEDEEGAPTPPLAQGIGGVERRGLVDIVRQQDHTPAAAIAIGGLAVNMNVEGQRENFYGQTLQREGGAAGSCAGGSREACLVVVEQYEAMNARKRVWWLSSSTRQVSLI